MKTYQWPALGAASAITAFQGLLFTSTTSVVSPVEPQVRMVTAEAARVVSPLIGATGRDEPSRGQVQ